MKNLRRNVMMCAVLIDQGDFLAMVEDAGLFAISLTYFAGSHSDTGPDGWGG